MKQHRTRQTRLRASRFVAALLALALIAAACGSDDDGDDASPAATTAAAPATTMAESPATTMADEPVTTEAMDDTPATTMAESPATTEAMDDGMSMAGTKVSVFGPESTEEEAGAMQDALDVFAERTGIEITYTGARDFSDQINAQAAGGNPPDIGVFPQPGKVGDFGGEGWILPIPDAVKSNIESQWPAGTLDTVTFGGTLWGIPNKTDLKSIVWYNTEIFESGGFAVPESLDELWALTFQMVAAGVTPWCVGIESGPATGWAFTDWMEDLVLRIQDENVYDQWVAGEVDFADERIASIAQTVLDVWNTPGVVYAAGGSIAATPFGDNGDPLVAGDCAMHRQASFFAAFLPEGTGVGPGQEIDVFYFPADAEKGNRPVLTAGTYVSAFRDAPEVWAVMEFLGSAEYAEVRQTAQAERQGGGQSGFLSANTQQDLSVYNDLERSFVQILQTASPARFDGSDLMPAVVGAGTFWTEGTSAVNGDKTVAEAFAAIDASWPE
ncbi:ABC transporter substrate-binding protein [Candidatus Poriferisodalis sp.]|uniref:ABC transporter substrate-binding protein n=1 Tax=Candidatus Poriferisodalis sp. TaxID=3101277 RepID=UPI003B025830